MINSVVNSSNNPQVFRDFSRNRDENFFMQQKTQEELPQKPSHKKRNLAYAIGSSALLVGVGVLVAMRGLPKNTTKYLEQIKEFLEKRVEKSSVSGSDKWNEVYVYSLRKIESFLNKSQSLNNLTSIKDSLFKYLMERNKYTAKIHSGITDAFEKVSRQTVKSGYKSTGKKFAKMFASFDNLDRRILSSNPDEIITINGKSLTKREWLRIAQAHRTNVKNSVESFISDSSQESRYKRIKKVTSKLYEQFWDASFKDFWTKENRFRKKEIWQTFITEDRISAKKTSLADEVAAIRNKITYTNADKMNLMKQQLKKLEELVLPSDKEGLNIIKKLKWFMENPEGLAENSEAIKKELSKLLDRPLQQGLDEGILKNQRQLRETYKKAITDLMDSKNSGELQEMLAIYEKIAPYELSLVKPQVTKAVKSFDKSLNTETVEFFDKLRDLALGSAPTDILSPIFSMGMIGYGLQQAKDADERMSVTLKAGIPILGTIGTMIYCTTRLIAGSKSLAFAGLSGVVLNQIGTMTDKIRKKYSKNPSNGQVA